MSHLVLSGHTAPLPVRRRRRNRLSGRTTAALAIAGLALLGTGACTGDEPADEPSTPTAEQPSAEASAEPTAEETPAEPSPEATPEATGVVLNAAGVGGIAMGTPDPRAALEALLGAPEVETADVACAPGDADALSWGALSVTTLDGALWGWDINPRRGALPATVVVESGVTPYQPLADALALPGATTPAYLESVDLLYVEAGGVQYYGSGSDPATAEIQLTGVNVIICG